MTHQDAAFIFGTAVGLISGFLFGVALFYQPSQPRDAKGRFVARKHD